jgi:hypothetical protein
LSSQNHNRLFIKSREEFFIPFPECRIDELLFQEPTTKISTSNSNYCGIFAQYGEVSFSSFYMENWKAVNLPKNSYHKQLKAKKYQHNLLYWCWAFIQYVDVFRAKILLRFVGDNPCPRFCWKSQVWAVIVSRWLLLIKLIENTENITCNIREEKNYTINLFQFKRYVWSHYIKMQAFWTLEASPWINLKI